MSRHPKPTPTQNAGRLVRQAATVLNDRKWIQGAEGDPDTGMCARGAINFTANGHTTRRSTSSETALGAFGAWLVKNRIASTLFGIAFPESAIPAWNDEPGRQKEEVIQYMNKFADEVDPQRP